MKTTENLSIIRFILSLCTYYIDCFGTIITYIDIRTLLHIIIINRRQQYRRRV